MKDSNVTKTIKHFRLKIKTKIKKKMPVKINTALDPIIFHCMDKTHTVYSSKQARQIWGWVNDDRTVRLTAATSYWSGLLIFVICYIIMAGDVNKWRQMGFEPIHHLNKDAQVGGLTSPYWTADEEKVKQWHYR